MKINRMFMLLFILIAFGLRCKQGTMPSTSGAIDPSLPTTSEAATAIVLALSTDNYGLSSQLSNATAISQFGYFNNSNASKSLSISQNEPTSSNTSLCGLKRDTLFSISNTKNTEATYKFSIAYYANLICSANRVSDMVFVDSTSGMYSGPKLSSLGTSKASFSSNFPTGSGDSTIVFNGTFTRRSSTQTKFGNKSIFSSDITLTFSGLTIGKTSHFISKGICSIEIQGASNKAVVFRYLGSADFSTPNQVKMVLEGNSLKFDLRTGTAL